VIKNFYNNIRNSEILELPHAKAGCLVVVEAPSDTELHSLQKNHKLDVDLLNDGLDPNEAPRIDRYDGRIYIYSRHVLADTQKQTTSPVLIIFGVDMVYVITRVPFADLSALLLSGKVTTSKRAQLLLEILNTINAGYRARINNVGKRIWRVRSQLNKSHIDNKDFISFIDIEEDLNDFLLALEPMNTQMNHLLNGKFIKLYEDDKDLMEDLELGSEELISQAASQLKTIKNIREAYSTITANNLNKVFKLMTSITILMGIFTLITGIYSMNIALPAAHNPNAFWIILVITGSLIAVVTYFFKKNKWF
jgi:magnesium transporter